MSVQGDRLIRALQKNPTLLFEVVKNLQDMKVAGPWIVRTDRHAWRVRIALKGGRVALVKKDGSSWVASTTKDPEGNRPREEFITETSALQWADAQLESFGYLLAKGS